jgi:hypothetical protein
MTEPAAAGPLLPGQVAAGAEPPISLAPSVSAAQAALPGQAPGAAAPAAPRPLATRKWTWGQMAAVGLGGLVGVAGLAGTILGHTVGFKWAGLDETPSGLTEGMIAAAMAGAITGLGGYVLHRDDEKKAAAEAALNAVTLERDEALRRAEAAEQQLGQASGTIGELRPRLEEAGRETPRQLGELQRLEDANRRLQAQLGASEEQVAAAQRDLQGLEGRLRGTERQLEKATLNASTGLRIDLNQSPAQQLAQIDGILKGIRDGGGVVQPLMNRFRALILAETQAAAGR